MANKKQKPLGQVPAGHYSQTEKLSRGTRRSIFQYAKKAISENLPIFDAYKENDPDSDIRFLKRDLKSKRVFGYLTKTLGIDILFKDVKSAWHNTKTSLKSGRFYDKRRANKAEGEMFKSMGLDLEMSELKDLENFDVDKEFDESEDSLDNFGENDLAQMEQDLESSFRGGADQISEGIIGGSEYIADSIKGASSLAYGQSMRSMKMMGQGFGNLSNQLVSLNKFNQEQIQQHIANSSKFFGEVTNLLAEQNGMLKEILEMKRNMYEQARAAQNGESNTGDIYDDIISSDGVINFKKYKENFERNLENGPFSMIPMFYNMVAKDFAANPVQFMMESLIKSLGGDKAERSLDKLQKTIVSSLGKLNARLLKAGEEGGTLGDILSLFAIHEQKNTEIKTEFEKGPMQFNGAANKAITEVIPMYLARIESALTGEPVKVFDMDKGTWTNTKDIRKSFDKIKSNSGNNVDDIVYTQFKNMADSNKFYFSDAEKRELQDVITNEVIPSLKKKHVVIDKNNIIENGELTDDFIDTIGIDPKTVSPKVQKMIGLVFKSMQNHDRDALSKAARDDRMAESDIVGNISNNPYSVLRTIFNGSLNGTNDSKFTIDKYTDIKSNGPINNFMSIGNEIEKSREVLKAIYNEIFSMHSSILSGAGGFGIAAGNGYYGKKNRAKQYKKMGLSSELANRTPIDLENELAKIDEEYNNATNPEAVINNPNRQEIFEGEIEIEKATSDKDIITGFKDFFEFVRSTPISKIGSKLGVMANSDEINSFMRVCKSLPAGFRSGNRYLDDLIAECKNGNYAVFNDENEIFRRAYRAINYKNLSALKKKKEEEYKSQGWDDEKIEEKLTDILNEDYKVKDDKDDDDYRNYKGSTFFDKLSKASGLDKLGVIHAGARHLISKPLDWILSKANKGIDLFGRVLSGDLSAFEDMLPSLDGMAYGGMVTKPGLYALSPGEQVIPGYLNPFNPARGIADPERDRRREEKTINRAKSLGLSVQGGRAFGALNTDKTSIMSMLRRRFNAEEIDLNDYKFKEKAKEWFRSFDIDKKSLKFVEDAIDTNDSDKLNIAITGITASEVIDKAREEADALFGKVKEYGSKILDLLPDNVRNNLKEIGKYGAWGAVAGIGSTMIGGPFGILGGALLGSATGFIHHSQGAQDLLFGPDFGTNVKKFMGKNGAKYATIGGTVGGLLGGPFGVLGGALLGSGYSFLESSDRFQKIMFGKKGIIARMDHFFGAGFKETRKSLVDYIKEAITQPIENAMVPVGTALQIGFKKTFQIVDKGLQNLVKPTFADLTNKIFGKYKDNKYFTGALGGAAGGALLGGPMGAILGGVVGSIAHGTGFDKKLAGIGKIPGQMLNSFSNRLAKWEIESGNGYNWSAQERINKMRDLNGDDSYKETGRGKFDVKLANSSRSEIVTAEMMLKMAVGKDPELDDAIKDAYYHIDKALALCGVDGDTKINILETIKKDTFKAKLEDIEEIVNKSDMDSENKNKLLRSDGEFVKAFNEYKEIALFVDKYKRMSPEEQKRRAVSNLGGIDDKEALEKHLKMISKERQNIDNDFDKLEETKTISTTSAVLDQTEILKEANENTNFIGKVLSALLYKQNNPDMDVSIDEKGDMTVSKKEVINEGMGMKRIVTTTIAPDGTRIIHTDFYDSFGNITSSSEEFRAKDGSKISNPDSAEALNAANADTKEEAEALKEKEAAEAREEKVVELLTPVAENAKTEIEDRKKSSRLKKAAKAVGGGIFGALKGLGKALFAPIKGIFGMVDAVMDSIPIVGDYWQSFKDTVGMKGKSLVIDKLKKYGSAITGKAISKTGQMASSAKNSKLYNWLSKNNMSTWGQKGTSMWNGSFADKFSKRNVSDYLRNKYVQAGLGKGYGINDQWFSTKNLQRAVGLSNKAGTIVSGTVGNVLKAGSGIARIGSKILGKVGGGVIKLGLGIIDALAVQNAIKSGQDAVDLNNTPEQNTSIIARAISGLTSGFPVAIDQLITAINNGGSSLLGDLAGGAAKKAAASVVTGAAGTAAGSAAAGAAGAGGAAAGAAGAKKVGLFTKVKNFFGFGDKAAKAAEAVDAVTKGKNIIDENKAVNSAWRKYQKLHKGATQEEFLNSNMFKQLSNKLETGSTGSFKNVEKAANAKKGIFAKSKDFIGNKYSSFKNLVSGKYNAIIKGADTTSKAVEAASKAAKTTEQSSKVVQYFKEIWNTVMGKAKKFLDSKTVKAVERLGQKILEKLVKPETLAKIVKPLTKRIVQIATGVGAILIAGEAIYYFYKGWDEAEKIWEPKEGEELTITKKAICGLINALNEMCLLSIFFDTKELVAIVKPIINGAEQVNQKIDQFIENPAAAISEMKQAAKNVWDKSMESLDKGWNAIKDYTSSLIDGAKGVMNDFVQGAKNFKQRVINLINGEDLNAHIQIKDDKTINVTESKTSEDNKTKQEEEKTKSKPTSARSRAAAMQVMKGNGDGGFFRGFYTGKGEGGMGTTTTSSSGGDSNPERIWKYLESKGLGSAAIAGIMGNIQQESGFMPNRVQGAGVKTAPEITVDGATGYGLCQWTYPTRQQALLDYARSKGKSSSDMETQLDFMLMEATQRDKGLFGRMAKMNAHDAAVEFHESYEGSADDKAGVSRRGDFAEKIYQTQGKGIATPGTFEASGVSASGGSTTVTFGGGSTTSSSGGLFGSISEALQNSSIGQLGEKLFGDRNFFFSGLNLAGSSSSSSGGGAGSSRSWGGSATPNIISGESGCADYKQDDERWWNAPYASSTVAKSGCMPTSFCNMASMFGITLLPPDACAWAGSRGHYVPGSGTAWAFYPDAGEHWKIPVHQCKTWDEVMRDLSEGKPVAAAFGKGGGWSGGGHWMLMTHVNDKGEVYVADSRANKHETGKDISGYHASSEAEAHWYAGGAYGADNIPDRKASKGNSVVNFLEQTLKGNITGKFNEDRDGGKHGGIDIGAAEGTIIESPIAGTVSKIAYEPGGFGHYLQIKDKKGKYHLFAHLKEVPKLELGNKINPGQKIAMVGSTGQSTGPHLHYQIDPESNKEGLKIGEHINPEDYAVSDELKNRINANNNSAIGPTNVADFKKNEYPSGDGGFGGLLDILKGGKPNKVSFPGLSGNSGGTGVVKDYTDKFDAIIQLLTTMVSLLQGGAGMNSAPAGAGNIAASIPIMKGTDKMITTTPGKSILNMIGSMLRIAEQ